MPGVVGAGLLLITAVGIVLGSLRLQPPESRDPTPLNATDRLGRRDLLGGLIHETEPPEFVPYAFRHRL
jgi:uncharacterized membrane protein YedE/YeeE